MNTETRCGRCGALLPWGFRPGLCPVCLLTAASEGVEDRAAADAAPVPLRIFGDYELLREIGRGGMGVVYLARQISLNRTVALKSILAGPFASPEALERFRAEAEAAANLRHVNIVTIYDYGEQDGVPFFSMEYVEGRSLGREISDSRFEISDYGRTAGLMHTLAEAVHYAHQQGVLHRDLKPANILIDAQGEPRITDFGLAKHWRLGTELTLSGQVLGSPEYMPPEQAGAGHGTVGPWSDVYSLGAILYRLLTGRPPFAGANLTEVLQRLTQTDPVSPRALNPSVPRDLATIGLKCLEKDPTRRYLTARELADELERYLEGEPIRARQIGWAGRVWRWCRRKPVVATLGACLLGALVIGMVGVGWQGQRATANARLAVHNAYAADMNLAAKALAEDDLGRALELLEKYRPAVTPGGGHGASRAVDLRGWEWRYLRQQCQGDELFSYIIQSNTIQVLALSADGRYLAVWGQASDLLVFDLTTGNRKTWPARTGEPRSLAFSPRTNLLALELDHPTDGGVVELWAIPSGEPRRLARPPVPAPLYDAAVHMAFSPDGTLAAGYGLRHGAYVWGVENREFKRHVPGPGPLSWQLGAVAFSPTGALLAIGEVVDLAPERPKKALTRVVDLSTGNEAVLATPGHEDAVTALAWSPDGRLLAAGYGWSGSSLLLWQVDKLRFQAPSAPPPGTPMDPPPGADPGMPPAENESTEDNSPRFDRLAGHRGWISCLVFTPDGRTLVSGSGDQTLRVWDVERRETIGILRGHRRAVTSVAFFPDRRHLVSAALDGTVRFWDLAAAPRKPARSTLPARVQAVFSGIAFSPDSRHFATVSPDCTASVWDAFPPRLRVPAPNLGTDNYSVALSSDGRWLVLGKTNGVLEVRNWPTLEVVTNLGLAPDPVIWLQFNARATRLLSVTYRLLHEPTFPQHEAGSWRPGASWMIQNYRSEMRYLATSPDDQLVGFGCETGDVGWFEAATGRQVAWLARRHTAAVLGVSFNPDSHLLATAAEDGVVKVWDVRSGRLAATLLGHRSVAVNAVWSPDGQRLITGGSDTDALKLWDVVSWVDVLTLDGDGARFLAQLAPDGNTLIAVNWQGVAQVWHAPSFEELEAAERAKERTVLEVNWAVGEER